MSDYVVMPKEDYQSICDAIRAKAGTTDVLKSGEVADKITQIKDVELYNSPVGRLYVKNMVLNGLKASVATNESMNLYAECINLETVEIDGGLRTGGDTGVFNACTNLKSAIIKNITSYGHYWFRDCQALEIAILGNINVPVTSMGNYVFYNCTQNDLTITLYVDALSFADIPTKVTSIAPWGATNATIIYRNSTTGEVITS